MSEEDDPFAVFGDDEEEDINHQEGQQKEELIRAQALVAQANTKKNEPKAPPKDVETSSHEGATFSSTSPFTMQRTETMKPYTIPSSWRPPLHVNHQAAALISNLDQYGGGRGYI
eukprot:CAMPEP_0172454848 /NCGR_PEP_ID=MMETSP1065-20121228/11718_1 /TAXON_ID=265537 /ORGANISM="Amphiprora paludosa, Strain CCMP125" /LENGTH=114 /DNA_ID=CAMNT_0013207247 /DNA_START=12 /DNA_END=353 /DNA_ORIENTATION=+